ncbi:MAG TPA: CotH kinase family protein, partial [Polyangiales bacterium]|nr:CotH kinase family protein [Polyangiales bacterium]
MRAEAKSGNDARAGSGGKSGGAGNQSKPVDAGKLSDSGESGATPAADGGMPADSTPSITAGSGPSAGSGGRASLPPAAGSGGSAAGSGTVDPSASAELFDQTSVVRFDITLPQASVDALGTAPDVYTHAGLTYRDTTLADVGIRIKGESSRRTLMQKAAFKIKLDEYVANQTLLGMKRITLNNMLSDDTYMAECLAYHVWRAAKLPAPRCNHAVVYVNDTYYGVYAHVESEDKTFLRRWFASDDGNLYEDGMADFVDGAASSFDLQTNETANDRTDLTALISAIGSASSATYLQDLDPVLDTAQFLRYSAMEAAVNQWDGYSYTYFEPNNFRVYHDPATRKFSFIPWG